MRGESFVPRMNSEMLPKIASAPMKVPGDAACGERMSVLPHVNVRTALDAGRAVAARVRMFARKVLTRCAAVQP